MNTKGRDDGYGGGIRSGAHAKPIKGRHTMRKSRKSKRGGRY